MTESSSKDTSIPVPGAIKIVLAYGFVGFACIAVLYIFMMLFWTNPMLNSALSVNIAQTFLLVVFIQFSTGFFTRIAVHEKYENYLRDEDEKSPSAHNELWNYGLLGGLFTGVFTFLFPAATVPLMYGNSSMWISRIIDLFSTFFPFILSGIIAGAAGSYSAGSLLKKGYLKGNDQDIKLREIFLLLTLISLLIATLPPILAIIAA